MFANCMQMSKNNKGFNCLKPVNTIMEIFYFNSKIKIIIQIVCLRSETLSETI